MIKENETISTEPIHYDNTEKEEKEPPLILDTKEEQNTQAPPVEKNITEEQIKYMYEHCITAMMQYLEENGIPITAEEKNEYAKKYDHYFVNYIGQPWEKLKTDLYKPEIYGTWDLYSLSIVYLIIAKTLNLSKYKDSSHFIEKYIKLWKSIVLALPGERKSLEEVQQEINQITL